MEIVDTYEDGGMVVKVLKGFEPTPYPQHKAKKSRGSGYINDVQKMRLVNWCNAGSIKNPRRQALSELSGIALNRIRNCITPGRGVRMTKSEYKIIAPLMAKIEEMEKYCG